MAMVFQVLFSRQGEAHVSMAFDIAQPKKFGYSAKS
jgi:hypothetical protein